MSAAPLSGSRHFIILLVLIAVSGDLTAQERFNYMPSKIGWHQGQYDGDEKHPHIELWTTWDYALEREMKWHINAPVNEHSYPSFVHNFMDAINAVPEWATAKTPDGKIRQVVKDYFPKPKNGKTYVIAHRGAHKGIPENTLAAFQKAIDLGCDFVEIDTRRTKDGRIVSVHNATVDTYVKGVSGKVGDFTLAELKAMDIGSRVGPEWKNERIPTIEEILQLCRGQIGIYLDLKEHLVPELIALLKKYHMERDVVWYIPASFMKPIMEIKRNCYKCQPMPDPGPAKNITKVVEKVHPHVIATDMGKLNEQYMEIANEHGVMVFVDEDKGNPAEWSKILSWGTQGIQTDDPEALIRFLKERNKEN